MDMDIWGDPPWTLEMDEASARPAISLRLRDAETHQWSTLTGLFEEEQQLGRFCRLLLETRETTLEWDLLIESENPAFGSDPHKKAFGTAAAWLSEVLPRTGGSIEVVLTPELRKLPDSWDPYLPFLMPLSIQPARPLHGWDSLVDPWVDFFPKHGDKVPSAYRIWQSSRRYLKAGDVERARRCVELNYLLHNSHIPVELELEGEILFGYGGVGVVLHKDAHIHPGVTIGTNTTVGSTGGHVRIDQRTGKHSTAPLLGPLVVLGAGSNVSGGLEIGALAIIAPNSVVTKDVAPGAIMAGAPAKPIGQVTQSNALRYKVKYLIARTWTDEQFLALCEKHLPKE